MAASMPIGHLCCRVLSSVHAVLTASLHNAGMQVDAAEKAEASTAEEGKPAAKDSDKGAAADGEKEAPAAKPEPSSHSLDNPARVVPAQEKLIRFPEGSRFMPIRPGRTAGILLLKDSSPGMTTVHACRNAVRACSYSTHVQTQRICITHGVARFVCIVEWHFLAPGLGQESATVSC